MRYTIISIVVFLISFLSLGQISIDNTTYTVTQLVDGVLIPTGSGTAISNVQFSGVYNNSGKYQIGHFSTAGTTQTDMTFNDGVVLSSGNTSTIPLSLGTDPGSVAQMATAYTSCTSGEVRKTGTCGQFINDLDVLAESYNYYNAAILEFDFVPVDNFVQFRYVFGSEEYQDNSGFINYQCSNYNDKFGFLISGPGISGGQGYTNDARNIALLGNGSEVGINSVNNGIVGSSGGAPSASNCQNANPAWIQNVSTAEFGGHIDGTQLNGNTIALTASQTGLTPGQTYHIKIIITDVSDATYDAVVYLEAGSFTTEAPCTPPAAPTASVTAQPDCTTPTGSIEVTVPTGTDIGYSIDGVNYQAGMTFTGLTPGTYDVTAQDTITGCTSTVTQLTVNTTPTTPAAPTASVTAQPNCTTSTGTIEITAPTGTDIGYSVDGVNYQAGTTFTGLTPGTYDVTAQDTVTGCTSTATQLIINSAPGTPATPTASVTVQPDCVTPTGTIVVTAPTGIDIGYSIDGVNYQAGMTFAGLIPGTYDVTAKDTITGCTSTVTQLTVDPVPGAPAAPTASVTVQPDCATPTGTIVVTAPTGTDIGYSIDGVNYQSDMTFNGLTPGSYDVTAQDTVTGCTSTLLQLVVNSAPGAPATPTATVTVQPNCITTTGTIVVTAPAGTDIGYSVDGTNYQAGTTFTGLTPGSYDITAQDTITGCTSATLQLTVNAIPNAPNTPALTVTEQPDCLVSTGTIEVTSPTGTDIVYSNDGMNYQSSTTFEGLTPGTYNITAQDTVTGCLSSAAQETIYAILTAPDVPSATVTVQPNCTIGSGTIEVSAPLGSEYQYSIDGFTFQSGTSFEGLAPGTFSVLVLNTNTNCQSTDTVLVVDQGPSYEDCNPSVNCGDLFIPSAFSPNGDLNNDEFRVRIEAACVNSFNLRVFDRWGALLFYSETPGDTWDGTYKGELLQAGVYVYTLSIQLIDETEPSVYSGNVTLFK